jgi:hypothetical protein
MHFMNPDWNKLLNYIVNSVVMPQARKEAQLDATAVRDVAAEVDAIREHQGEDAHDLAPAFAQGMEMAYKGNGPFTVDDTTPEGNAIASAFARYLVAPGLAESQSTEIGTEKYSYTFDVKWPRLREIAQAAGVRLPNDPSPR